jgi:hypothetical protein
MSEIRVSFSARSSARANDPGARSNSGNQSERREPVITHMLDFLDA